MFRILLKKQMTEIFRGYFYDSKKNKKRSTASTILFLGLYLVILVGILGGMFGFLSVSLCKPFAQLHMSWLYFLIMSMIAIALGAFGSIFNTYTGLYLSKDNDLLLSLPIPVGSILAARLMSVYLLGLMYSAVVIVPAVVVYWIVVPVSFLEVLGSLLLMILVSMIVLILSCVLGWCVAKMSQKFKNRSFLTVFASLIFMAAYYFVYYKAQLVITDLLSHAQEYGEKLKASAYPLYLFGKMGEGNIPAMLLCTIIVLGIWAFTFALLSKSFLSIVTASGKTEKIAYKEKKTRQKSTASAMFAKEFSRFTANPNYMLNCGLGSVFLVVLGGVLLAKGAVFMQGMQQVFGAKGGRGIPAVLLATAVCVVASMNDSAVPSVSLEGKNIWIAQSLPVEPWDSLRAKLMVQILVTAVPVLFCDICIFIVLKSSPVEMLLTLVITELYVVLLAMFGLFLGLKMPNLTWTNENAPIKQSINVMIAMFGGSLCSIAMGILYVIAGWVIGELVYLAVFIAVFACFCILLYFWLKKRGTEIFRWL